MPARSRRRHCTLLHGGGLLRRGAPGDRSEPLPVEDQLGALGDVVPALRESSGRRTSATAGCTKDCGEAELTSKGGGPEPY